MLAVLVALLLAAVGCASSDDTESTATTTTTTTTSATPSSAPTTTAHGGCTPARPAAPGTTLVEETVGGIARSYRLAIPSTYDGTTEMPLLVNLHGIATTIDQIDNTTRLSVEGNARGYIVVTPQGPVTTIDHLGQPLDVPVWTFPGAHPAPIGSAPLRDDAAYLIGLVDQLEQDLCIDRAREYVVGISNGAQMATGLICHHEPRFAAVAAVAGVNVLPICDASQLTSLVAFHGTADAIILPGGASNMAEGIEVVYPSVEKRMAELASVGGCDASPAPAPVAPDVQHLPWSCPSVALELYTIVDGGHTWPGGPDPTDAVPEGALLALSGRKTMSVDATSVILDFFDEHRR